MYHNDETSERNIQHMTEKDMEQNFINYQSIVKTIVNHEEPQTLKNLCKEYSNILESFGLYKTVKSDCIKELLIFHWRYNRLPYYRWRKKLLLCTVGEEAKLITKQY